MADLQPRADSNDSITALGQLIVTRKKGTLDKVIYLLLIAIGTPTSLGLIAAGVLGLIEGKIPTGLIVMTAGVGGTAACVFGFRALFRVVEFHERGAIERLFSRRREFLYADADSLTFGVTRQYYNGVYAGTSLSLRLRMADGRKLSVGGRYKEKPKGMAITIFGKTFESNDEIDVVRDVIAANIAKRLMARIQSEGSVEWASGVRLSLDGITSRGGRRKNQLVAWSDVAGFRIERGFAHIFAAGDKKSFVTLSCAGRNFYPGWQLVASFAEAHTAPAEPVASA